MSTFNFAAFLSILFTCKTHSIDIISADEVIGIVIKCRKE